MASKKWGGWFANAVFFLVGLLPLKLLHVLGQFAGWLLWRLPGSYRARAQENLANAVPEQAQGLLKPALFHVAALFLEMPYWWTRPARTANRLAQQVHSHDWSDIDAQLAKGKGLILISPHVGNFELLGPLFTERHRATVMFRIPRIAWLRDWLLSLRNRGQLSLVPADSSGVRALAKALKRGETIGILPDQVPIEGEGVWASFFGRAAYTTTLVQRLQHLTDAPVMVLCAYRDTGSSGFYLKNWLLDEQWPQDPAAHADRMNKALETAILACPAQYLWGYDRYRQPRVRPLSSGRTVR